jgi:hypothetical protein
MRFEFHPHDSSELTGYAHPILDLHGNPLVYARLVPSTHPECVITFELMPCDLPRDLDGLWRASEQHVFDAAFGPAPSRRMPASFANEEAEVFGDVWK